MTSGKYSKVEMLTILKYKAFGKEREDFPVVGTIVRLT